MKRSPLARRATLRRKRWIRRVNWRRRATRRAEAFGPQARLCYEMNCCACGRWGSEPHHEPPRSCGGTDADALPVCPDDHRLGPKAIHRIGRRAFEEIHCVDLGAVKREMRRRVLELAGEGPSHE